MFNAMKAAAARAARAVGLGSRSPSPISSSPGYSENIGSNSEGTGISSHNPSLLDLPTLSTAHYVLFKKIPGNPSEKCTDKTNIGNNEFQCVKSSKSTALNLRQILLQYQSTKSAGELLKILNNSIYHNNKSLYNEILENPRIGNPYGYLQLKIDNDSDVYLIVPLKEKDIPILKNIVQFVPETTDSPEYFRLKFFGGRRRTRSRSYKKRRSTRRRNSRN